MEFSTRNFTKRWSAAAPEELADGSASAEGSTRGPAADPALANVPKELWPATWQPPAGFSSAQEERQYLALMSDHWQTLSAKQRAYYDDGVKKALAREEAEESRKEEAEVKEKETGAAAGAPSSDGGSRTPTPTSSSSLSDIKKRLAERKAVLTAKAAVGGAPAQTSPAPEQAVAAPVEPTSAVSSLKQRLAQKKAQLASASSTSPADPPTSSTARQQRQPQDAAAAATSPADSPAPVSTFLGFPVPPCEKGAGGGVGGVRTLVEGMPWEVAERVVPPTLLATATAASYSQWCVY